jgi:hypothetical protein
MRRACENKDVRGKSVKVKATAAGTVANAEDAADLRLLHWRARTDD